MSLRFILEAPLLQEAFESYGEKLFSSVRPAAQAMAQVYYEALLRSYDAAGIKTKTGNLRGSLYQAFKPEYSKALSERQYTLAKYSVSWARNEKMSKKASQHAHLVEYGHAFPFKVVRTRNGYVTARNPKYKGPPPPEKDARYWPESVRRAYFIPVKGPIKYAQPKTFMRPVFYSTSLPGKALDAARRKFAEVMQ